MLFTDNFVYIHQPKTGGTFVTTVLLRLHEFRWNFLIHGMSALKKELIHKNKYGTFIYNNNKHGLCSDIPEPHRKKIILATIRNPYDLYVSQYEFGWWKRKDFFKNYRAIPDFETKYPNFPNINFADYIKLTNQAFGQLNKGSFESEDSLGLQTEEFIKYYFINPKPLFSSINYDYVSSQRYKTDMFNIHFIKTSFLNEELYHFLLDMGYNSKDLKFILELRKILPGGKGRSKEQVWEQYYTPELKQMVRKKERLIFTIFPEFDV